MNTATAEPSASTSNSDFIEHLNTDRHELALRVFMVIVLAHWVEHLLQGLQIYVLGWPVPEARGALGLLFPWLIKSEALHYGYAVVMLIGLWTLRSGFTGKVDHFWWMLAFWIQFFHHIEHAHPADAGDHRSQPARPSGADEPRAALGPARRAAPVLQHHRVHPDGDCDVLPPVPARRGEGPGHSARARSMPRGGTPRRETPPPADSGGARGRAVGGQPRRLRTKGSRRSTTARDMVPAPDVADRRSRNLDGDTSRPDRRS